MSVWQNQDRVALMLEDDCHCKTCKYWKENYIHLFFVGDCENPTVRQYSDIKRTRMEFGCILWEAINNTGRDAKD